ncbi:hypothetical protein TIFTF001_023010 [Ficus carica]|uniref:Uncharacterized protein n=1 Tax=Ficus carica TaxID=3494 RepID=A0AA88AFF8_FICCA|nr:hypothetical protein TIFTF001_023010 [Ficus carica]
MHQKRSHSCRLAVATQTPASSQAKSQCPGRSLAMVTLSVEGARGLISIEIRLRFMKRSSTAMADEQLPQDGDGFVSGNDMAAVIAPTWVGLG